MSVERSITYGLHENVAKSIQTQQLNAAEEELARLMGPQAIRPRTVDPNKGYGFQTAEADE